MTSPSLKDWQPNPNTSYPPTAFPLEVQEMFSEANEIGKRWLQKHTEFQSTESPSEFLYHYTDAHGMHGIAFDPGCLWLSDYRTTNDPTEGKYVLSLVSQSCRKYFPGDFPISIIENPNRNLNEDLQAFSRSFSESLRPRLLLPFHHNLMN